MGWLRMSLRRLRLAPVQTAALALLVGVTALVFAVAPRALQSTGDAILRDELQAAPVDARSLELVQLARIEAGSPDLLANVSTRGAGFEAQFPPEVARLVSGTDVVVDTTRFRLEAPTLEDRTLRLRIQPPAAGHIHFVDGAFPTGTTTTLPAGSVTDPTFPPGPVTVVPVALSTASAAALQAQVGQTLLISLDPTDLANRGAQLGLAVEVTGIFAVDEPTDAFWFDDASLDQPVIRSLSALAQVQDVTALLAPSVYPALLAASDTEQEPLRYHWRYTVDVTRLDQAGAPGVITQLRRLQGLFPSAAGPAGPDPVLQGALGQLLEAEQASWQAAQVVLAVVAIGPAMVAAAALALMAVLTGQRRRSSLFLARARGASRAQVWLSLLAEGTLLALPAAACAAFAAALLVPDGPTQATVIAAAAVAVVSVVLVVATTLPGVGDRGPSTRPGGPARGAGTRRRVLESLTVVLALGGAWLLLQRGVRGASSTGSLSTVDPFIAAVPALVGLAAGLILRRVYPMVMAAAGRAAGARRDLVPVLAMRRATSGGSGGSVLLVLLAAAALGTFASAVLVHLDGAANAIAWQEVGAPFALTSKSGPFPPGFAPQDLPGVTSATAAYLGPATVVDRGAPVQLLALDASAYEALVAGTPADPHLPAGMRVGVSGALPVIVSTSLGGGAAGIGVGDDRQLSIAGQTRGRARRGGAGHLPVGPCDGRLHGRGPRQPGGQAGGRHARHARLVPGGPG